MTVDYKINWKEERVKIRESCGGSWICVNLSFKEVKETLPKLIEEVSGEFPEEKKQRIIIGDNV